MKGSLGCSEWLETLVSCPRLCCSFLFVTRVVSAFLTRCLYTLSLLSFQLHLFNLSVTAESVKDELVAAGCQSTRFLCYQITKWQRVTIVKQNLYHIPAITGIVNKLPSYLVRHDHDVMFTVVVMHVPASLHPHETTLAASNPTSYSYLIFPYPVNHRIFFPP